MTETLEPRGIEAARKAYAKRWMPDDTAVFSQQAAEQVDYIIRAYLAATRSPHPADADGVRVRDLEWTKHPTNKLWRAHSLLGLHKVYAVNHISWVYEGYDGTEANGTASTVEAAFAAAQADFATRIKSSLIRGEAREPDPAFQLPADPSTIPDDCDGVEQNAFEAWAADERFNMEQHPLHWLFLDDKTSAARRGWRAGIRHARARILALIPSDPKTFEEAPAPTKMHFTNEWLRDKIASDPDIETEAGVLHPEAPAPQEGGEAKPWDLTPEQADMLAYVVHYSSVFCAPENIKQVVDEIDCCPGCEDTSSSGSTCYKFERGEYCPNQVAEAIREIGAALYGPRPPSFYKPRARARTALQHRDTPS